MAELPVVDELPACDLDHITVLEGPLVLPPDLAVVDHDQRCLADVPDADRVLLVDKDLGVLPRHVDEVDTNITVLLPARTKNPGQSFRCQSTMLLS